MSAWKSRAIWSVCALVIGGCSDGGIPLPFVEDKKKSDEEFTLRAKVRDFKEGNATSNDGTHPHFNQTTWTCEAQSMGSSVEDDLATDGASDGSFPGDNRDPRLAGNLSPQLARCFNPADRFSDWFNDKSDDVNRPYLITLQWTKTGSGTFLLRQDKFFPLDNGASYTKARSGVPDPFGHLQSGSKDEVDLSQHNYGFTMETHGQFKYVAGGNQSISVRGDDDLWIFIHGKRIMDLGGTHPAQAGTVALDGLGLTGGQVYPIDIFFAERSVASSNLTIETNFPIAAIK